MPQIIPLLTLMLVHTYYEESTPGGKWHSYACDTKYHKRCTSSHDNRVNPNSLQTLLQSWLAENNLNPSDPRLVCVSMCLCVRKRITSEQWITGSLRHKYLSCLCTYSRILTPCGLTWIINRESDLECVQCVNACKMSSWWSVVFGEPIGSSTTL